MAEHPRRRHLVIAGLSAGCHAAMSGYRVTLLEIHDLPGGLCTFLAAQGLPVRRQRCRPRRHVPRHGHLPALAGPGGRRRLSALRPRGLRHQQGPRYDHRGLDGFFMAGQWVESWGGITTAAQSGRNAVRALCKKDEATFRG